MPQPPKVRLPPAPRPAGLSERGERQDIHRLFSSFNEICFVNSLSGVFVEYSQRMTSCAGTCTYLGRAGGCRIALSEPILTRRPPSDTVDTLLHEMIHASLFLRFGVRRDGPDGHGPRFLAEADRINRLMGSNITVYHNFHDEVDFSRVHWWTCQGHCGRIIKRAINRRPMQSDSWWNQHMLVCGGSFVKTHEPPPKAVLSRGVLAVGAAERQGGNGATAEIENKVVRVRRIDEIIRCPVEASSAAVQSGHSIRDVRGFKQPVNCSVCLSSLPNEAALDSHLEECLGGVFESQPRARGKLPRVPQSNDIAPKKGLAADFERRSIPGACSLPRKRVGDALKVPMRAGHHARASMSKWSRFMDECGEIVDKARLVVPDSQPNTPNPSCDEENEITFVSMSKSVKPSNHAEALDPLSRMSKTKSIPEAVLYGALSKEYISVFAARDFWRMISTNDMRRFALGHGSGYAPINREFMSLDQSVGQRVEKISSIPPLPAPLRGPNKRALEVEQVVKQLSLWVPGTDPNEAPFAAIAARQGLTTAEVLARIKSSSTRQGVSLVVSESTRQLFTGPGASDRFIGPGPVAAVSRPLKRQQTAGQERGKQLTSGIKFPHPRSTASDVAGSRGSNLNVTSIWGHGPHNKFTKPELRTSLHDVRVSTSSVPEKQRASSMANPPTLYPINDETTRRKTSTDNVTGPLCIQPTHAQWVLPSAATKKALSRNDDTSRRGNTGNGLNYTVCPICEKQVPRTLIATHLRDCISDIEGFDDVTNSRRTRPESPSSEPRFTMLPKSDEQTVRVSNSNHMQEGNLESQMRDDKTNVAMVASPPVPIAGPHLQSTSATANRGANASRAIDMSNCPVCGCRIPRAQLETHATQCIDREGLADAFA